MYALIEEGKVVAISNVRPTTKGKVIKVDEATIGQEYANGALLPFNPPPSIGSFTIDDAIEILNEIVDAAKIKLKDGPTKERLLARKK